MSSIPTAQQKRELMIFHCDGREFCLDIMQVRDIRGWTPATPLPHAPAYMRGVINLRGQVLPIVDMAMRLGCARTEPTAKHVIIVAQTGDRTAGLLVEAVSDVMMVTQDQIQPTPDLASALAQSYVQGVLAVDGRMVCMLALEQIIPPGVELAA